MICQTCRGDGVLKIRRDGKIVGIRTCTDCIGGISSCCDGIGNPEMLSGSQDLTATPRKAER